MKIVMSIFIAIVFGFVGYFATVIAAIVGGMNFYAPLVAIISIAVILFMILAIYNQLKKKAVRISIVVFISAVVIAIAAYEIYQSYLDGLEVVSTQDFDLYDYRPFEKDTKAITLNEESTLTIQDQLPTLDGATALYPVYAAFVQAVYPEKDYPLYQSEVKSSQTNNAFDNLLDGSADIIFMAHPSDRQLQKAEIQDVELEMTPIGREAFVFFVNQNNPVQDLSIEEIKDIYAGEIKNWKELGGNDQPIRAFQRPEGSGSQTALLSVMDGKKLMAPPTEDIVSGMGGIIEQTSEYKNRNNAIGFSFRFFSEEMVQNGEIKHLAINGVEPTIENIQNETYPIVDQFYAITANRDNPNSHIEAFLDWMVSEQGQQIVETTGYVPVK